MKWRIPMACRIQQTTVEGTMLWFVDVLESAISLWALALCLLESQLISEIVVADEAGNTALRLSRMDGNSNARALVTWEDSIAALGLSGSELGMWKAFFLRTVRDGVAEVDHFDVEADGASRSDLRGDFVIKFPVAAQAVSPEEARRRLGL